jgi:hypothetical protein
MPLRHHRDEPAAPWQMAKIGDAKALSAHNCLDIAHFVVRLRQEAVE